jgi:hypothetical protein
MGALKHFQSGGEVDDDPYADSDNDGDPDAAGGYANTGALTQGQAPPSDEEVQRYQQLGGALSGSPQEVTGALSRQNQSIDDAYAEKKSRLDRALSVLRASGQGQTNLPLLLAGAAMMGAPAQTFGQSVMNAANAAAPAIEKQRAEQYKRAIDEGNLDVSGADLDVQRAKEHRADWFKQQDLGERYLRYSATLKERQVAEAQRVKAEKDLADYRDRMAKASEDRVKQAEDARAAAQEKAKAFNKWIGTDPESNLPIFQNDLGQTKIGDAPINAKPGAGGRGGGKTVTDRYIDIYYENHKNEVESGQKTKAQVMQDAADYAKGSKVMTPQQALREGYITARAQLANTFPPASSDVIDARAHEVAKMFMQTGQPTPAAQQPAAQPPPLGARLQNAPLQQSLPPQAAAALKEGVISHFGNGQSWTLQGGKPVRLK